MSFFVAFLSELRSILIVANAGDWDAKKWDYNTDKCEKQQGGNFMGECCFNQEGLATWFNANKQCCSDDGALYALGTCV